MMIVTFFMMMDPPTTTQQEHRLGVSKKGKPYMYDGNQVAAARDKLRSFLWHHRLAEPLQGPLELAVMWCFPLTGDHVTGEWKITRPDTENLQKLLKDCMTECKFWKDDAQVCSENIKKIWSETPGILIRIETLDNNGIQSCLGRCLEPGKTINCG